MAGLCEHGDEQLVSVRCGNFSNRGGPTLNLHGVMFLEDSVVLNLGLIKLVT